MNPNYVQAARDALSHYYPDAPKDRDDALMQLYTLLVLTKRSVTTKEDVHDAWAVWKNMQGATQHPCLVPYDELTDEQKNLDEPYRLAICQAARDVFTV